MVSELQKRCHHAAEAKLRQDEEKAEEQKEAVAKPPEDKRPRRSVAKVLAQYLETSRESTPSCSNMIWYTMIAPCHQAKPEMYSSSIRYTGNKYRNRMKVEKAEATAMCLINKLDPVDELDHKQCLKTFSERNFKNT